MKIFISRHLNPSSLLVEQSQKEGWTLNAFSLIKHTVVSSPFPSDPFDLLFFSSPAAVRLFCSTHPLPDVPVCTIGPGTTASLPSGISPVFEGRGKTQDVANEFASFAKGKRTLFPVGLQSLQTIQKGLPAANVVNLICYKTQSNSTHVDPHDIYIFTSPSNVQSFIELNQIAPKCTVIALGEKTFERLQEANIKAIIAKDYTQQGILDTIFSIDRS